MKRLICPPPPHHARSLLYKLEKGTGVVSERVAWRQSSPVGAGHRALPCGMAWACYHPVPTEIGKEERLLLLGWGGRPTSMISLNITTTPHPESGMHGGLGRGAHAVGDGCFLCWTPQGRDGARSGLTPGPWLLPPSRVKSRRMEMPEL